MQFVNPFLLYGLFAISIPIIIHLFNFRRFKKVYFTNVKFLQELKQKTQRKSQLRHLLVLILRILAICCLVIAFAQPYIPLTEKRINFEKMNVISIYIDNSFSMEAASSNGSLIDIARKKAYEILSVYKSSDLFNLITNDFEGKHQQILSKEEFIEYLDEVTISPAVRNLSDVYLRQRDILSSSNVKIKNVYLISDFQKSVSDIYNIDQDTTITTYFIPLAANEINNIYIDSCWFETPILQQEHHVELLARMKNISNIDYEKIPVKLIINRNQRAVASFDIKSKSETVVNIPFTIHQTGIQHGWLEIDDHPITYDDKFFFSYKVSAVIPMLSINGNKDNEYIKSVYDDSAFVYKSTSVNNIDYSSFSKYNLILLNELNSISSGLAQEIKRFVKNSGNLVVIPSEKIDVNSYQHFLNSLNSVYYTALDTFNTRISELNTQHPIFEGVFEKQLDKKSESYVNIDLPHVFSYYVINRTIRSKQESIIDLQNNNPFISVMPYDNGLVYLFAVPLKPEFSNFPRHAIFVPVMYNIALLSEPKCKLFYTLGKDEIIELGATNVAGEDIFIIKKDNSDFEVIPEHKRISFQTKLYPHDQLKEADNYIVFREEEAVTGISYNYNRKESDLTCNNKDELKKLIEENGLKNVFIMDNSVKPLSTMLMELNHGIKLWKLFIILALLFLAGEVILLRYWK